MRLNHVEQTFLDSVCKEIKDPVINSRVSYLFKWYTRKAQRNKLWYHITRFITYLIPCLITLISVFVTAKSGENCDNHGVVWIAVLSAVLAVIHHIIDHFRFYENWIRYRTTVEYLKEEAELFLNGCKPYKQSTQSAKDGGVQAEKTKEERLFAQRIEALTKNELQDWTALRKKSHRTLEEESQANLHNSGTQSRGGASSAAASDSAAAGEAEPAGQPCPESGPQTPTQD